MKSNRHILFLSPGFPQNQQDSWVVTYFANYIKAFKNSNSEIQISIVTLEYPYLGQLYNWNTVPIYSMVTTKHKIYKPLKWIKVINLVKDINRKSKITTIHSLWLRECSFLAQHLGKMIKAKVICSAMGTELKSPNPYLRWINFNKIHLVAVSEFMQSHIKEKLKLDSVVIPWGIPEHYANFDHSMSRSVDLLFVGFLNELKNLKLFLEIVQALKKYIPKVNAVVIGEEYTPHHVKSMIDVYEIASEVKFEGRLKNKEVLKYMRNSKLLIHTSDFESMGYVMLEALSCGMNIISKKVGIAKKSKKWDLAETLDQFVALILEKLGNPLSGDPLVPYLMSDTINGYKKLYEPN